MNGQPTFKIGETVRLRVDGSPTMTVDGVETEGRLVCVWTDGAGTIQSHAFPVRSLRAASLVEGADATAATST